MRKPNLLFFGVDSLRADRMSTYGYPKLTTPHIDDLAGQGVSFTNCISPSIPTPPGYSSMLTGRDCFGTDIVTLRLENGIPDDVPTLAEVLGAAGYNTTCVGFNNPAGRGFQNYLEFPGWGSYADGRSPKAENLNSVAIPELKRLAADDKPFFLFMRHMDPHSPYLPPRPFERMFYDGDECDPANGSLDKVMSFKPFCDYFATWFPPKCTDTKYIEAQYDGELAYMDSCIQNILTTLKTLDLEEDTFIILTSDHGETLNDHDCYFDHHGMYECTLHVPMILKFPGKIPDGYEFDEPVQLKDLMPTILEVLGIDASGIKFDGRSLAPLWRGEDREPETEMYITECTWMRKHGWRTQEWKLMLALEPDFHYKPPVELYNLKADPGELHNVADENPELVAYFTRKINEHVAKREKEVGRKNPMYRNENWSGAGRYFTSSDEAYNTLHIGDANAAKNLQRK